MSDAREEDGGVLCLGCGAVTHNRLSCPVCAESLNKLSYFCTQECFRRSWKVHEREQHPSKRGPKASSQQQQQQQSQGKAAGWSTETFRQSLVASINSARRQWTQLKLDEEPQEADAREVKSEPRRLPTVADAAAARVNAILTRNAKLRSDAAPTTTTTKMAPSPAAPAPPTAVLPDTDDARSKGDARSKDEDDDVVTVRSNRDVLRSVLSLPHSAEGEQKSEVSSSTPDDRVVRQQDDFVCVPVSSEQALRRKTPTPAAMDDDDECGKEHGRVRRSSSPRSVSLVRCGMIVLSMLVALGLLSNYFLTGLVT